MIEPDAVSGKISVIEQCKIRIETAAGAIVREVRARNNASLAAMVALVDSLRDVEARKTIVYVSGFGLRSAGAGAAAAVRLASRRPR